MKLKRILSIIALCAWGGLIAATVAVAFIGTDESRRLLTGLIYTDIILPVVIYAAILISKALRDRKNNNK
ncbi:MAG: hypothetical protein KHZ87_05410 [Clostridiales bacterium]|nr:hypothetical protein [Clostridiales bacterium]MBS5877410.1 hypothetical protein [Clostridiales bacterium]MDU0938746.1 hypothetical protein [Clostridiales bacterium]MDU1041614.1 hypothetical protein [Clostridiales bacterium]MDU3490878.1 hypothetical protein [Clostridiales bacterium]